MKTRLNEDINISERAIASRGIIVVLLEWDRQTKAACDCYSNWYELQAVSPGLMMVTRSMKSKYLTRVCVLC